MKTLAIIILAVLLGTMGVHAQNVDREVFPEQVSIEHNQAVRSFSSDFVITLPAFSPEIRELPTVDRQTAMLTQMGDMNNTALSQRGAQNYAELVTIGDRNKVGWSQVGTGNWVKLDLTGDDNNIDGTQFGSDNRLNLIHTGNGINQSYEQIGNSHFLEVSGVGIPMSVTQRGNGAALIIENR